MQTGDGRVRAFVQRVVGHQFADGSLAAAYLVHQFLQSAESLDSLVVEVGIIDELTNRPLAAAHGVDQVIDFGQDGVELLDGALAGFDDIAQVGRFCRLHLSIVLQHGACGVLAVDVHDGVSKDTYRLQARPRVGVQGVLKVLAQRHGDFHRGEPAFGHDAHRFDVSNGDAFKVDWSADLDARSILKVRTDNQPLGEEAAATACHQENQRGECHQCSNHQHAHLQL